MYICLCAAVTDRAIRAKVLEGAQTLDDLRIDLGVALACGTCASAAEGIIAEMQAQIDVPVRAGREVVADEVPAFQVRSIERMRPRAVRQEPITLETRQLEAA
jgi:bacterioferritin-associated ferredoxin